MINLSEGRSKWIHVSILSQSTMAVRFRLMSTMPLSVGNDTQNVSTGDRVNDIAVMR